LRSFFISLSQVLLFVYFKYSCQTGTCQEKIRQMENNFENIVLERILNRQISKRINELIERKGITPYKLMDDLEINKSTFYRSIKDERNWSLENLIKIAHYFNVSLDFLIDGEEKSRSPNDEKIKELEEENRLLRGRLSQINDLTQAIENLKKRKRKL